MKGTPPFPFASVPRLQAAMLCEMCSQTYHRAWRWHLLIAGLVVHSWKTKTSFLPQRAVRGAAGRERPKELGEFPNSGPMSGMWMLSQTPLSQRPRCQRPFLLSQKPQLCPSPGSPSTDSIIRSWAHTLGHISCTRCLPYQHLLCPQGPESDSPVCHRVRSRDFR